MPEDHEVLGTGAIDEENTHNTSDYDTTTDLYVANIDKNEKYMEDNLPGNCLTLLCRG